MIGSDMKVKDIDRINGIIDRPSAIDKDFMDTFRDINSDIFGLYENGSHRNYNHDLLGAIKAISADPDNGFQVYMSHIMLDKMSNMLRDSFGTDNRDVAEILFNRALKSVNNSQKLYKSSNPFLKKLKLKREPAYNKKIKRNKFYKMKKSSDDGMNLFF